MIKRSFLSGILFLCVVACFGDNYRKNKKIIVAYVTSWTKTLPDPRYVTHINYAFGHVTATFDGVRIDNEQRLREIASLKTANPHLKILLSIGGWGSGGFSEMAADAGNREKFSNDCARIVKQFELDGIDIDWEYPTSKAGGISATQEDTRNFTLLMKQIRKSIGRKKLLTLASVISGQYIDFAAIKNLVNFVNIMAYDAGRPPKHHAALYRSAMTGWASGEEAVNAHKLAGMPSAKLVLGIPLYGRGNKTDIKEFVHYRDLVKLEGFISKWDSVAQVPYLVNAAGEFVCSFESPESIAIKGSFIREKGLLGAMYWEHAGDTEDNVLGKAIFSSVVTGAD
ncbi:glycosyl hydrolase family 18 protein [Niabella pedocola]|uniref:chitinase n=1 Tax=Niabella pedocola TaxID=1752077 RepID=A0ABS8PUP6_9BACT|nr:glycosyl hydrolase family 18 protein [Niabella pedocola]MCD2424797.1 glycosyl hydrolase family 18 protein [Niabella pedocola]